MESWAQKAKMQKSSILACLLSLGAFGCAMAPVHVAKLRLNYGKPMVAQKVAIPLYIVVDPKDVPDRIVNPTGSVKETRLFEIRTFVNRDVKSFFQSYFESVTVVAGKNEIPETQHVAVDVRIASVRLELDSAIGTGGGHTVHACRAFGLLDWSIGVRLSSEPEYILSYSDRVFGTTPMVSVNQTSVAFKSTFETALTKLGRKYEEQGIHRKLLSLTSR